MFHFDSPYKYGIGVDLNVFIVNFEHWEDSGDFIVNFNNFEHNAHLFLIFEQVNVSWDFTC